jgi:hypothetical protein
MENLDLLIITAARQGETEVLKELLRRGANVDSEMKKDIPH